MTPDRAHILFEYSDGVARITLNRPPLNILNTVMMEETAWALEETRKQRECKALLLRATGKSFSAGVDVGEHRGEQLQPMLTAFHRIFHLLAEIEVPTIAAVQGPALGGGCELATFCDIVIASERARFGQTEIKLGVFPPVAALTFPERVGTPKALELLLTGEIIEARQAERIGLITRSVFEEDFEEEVEILLRKLREKSAVTLALTKRAVRAGLGRPFAEGLSRVERIYLHELMKTEDAEEGLRSFLEKRKPVWKNR